MRLVTVMLPNSEFPIREGIPFHKLQSVIDNINCNAPVVHGTWILYSNRVGVEDSWNISIESSDFLENTIGTMPPEVKLDSYMFGISKRNEFPWDLMSPTLPRDILLHIQSNQINQNLLKYAAPPVPKPVNVPSGMWINYTNAVFSSPSVKQPETTEQKSCQHFYKHYYGKLEICVHCNEFKPDKR